MDAPKTKAKGLDLSTTKEEYGYYIEKYKKQPRKHGKDELIDKVYDRINEREIWIPYYEAKAHINKYIDRHNRKPHDIVSENGKTVTIKPVIHLSNNSSYLTL